MIVLVQSMQNLLNSIGISAFGSSLMFGLAIIIAFFVLMLLLGVPTPFILVVISILGIGVSSFFGDNGLRIIWTVISVVLGVIAGLFILRFFSTSTN
jgi:hypothetical protein